ncbi:MAG TPA: BTAD domain-containing putative transcriptional regulator, partial [Ilumatobacteraceae bacterium]|nr:BTAD domain-containing putative transcriptional regulator [Ilumatobacteraceae bacterium]
ARHRTLLDESSGGDQIADLERAVAEHPYRENLTELLMLALYRAGRQSDALHRFDELRRRLGDELGLEPSPQLRDLELAILTHSDELSPASTSGPAVNGAAPPLALTTFVGRSREIEQLVERSAQHRLVTVVGPGGVGKTRLVSEAFARFDDTRAQRAWFVPLADVELDELLANRVAAVIGLDAPPRGDATDAVIRHLQRWSCVLVLDNCENVIDAAATFVHRLLAACPGVSVVATSREPLMLQGEQTVALHGLPVVGAPTGDAESLFLSRLARSLDPADEPLVSTVCRLVDGWPLAIELIAANVAPGELGATVGDLEARINDLDTPYRFVPGRHASLGATLDWSYDLLSGSLQTAYRWLGMFDGAITTDDAHEVLVARGGLDSDLDHVGELVDRSLVEPLDDERRTVRLLRPVVQHARALLAVDADENARVRASYVAHYGEFAAQADDALDGPDGAEWATRVRAEEPNVLRAIEVSLDDDSAAAADIATHIAYYWLVGSTQPVGLAWIERVIDRAEDRAEPAVLVGLHQAAGFLAGSMGHKAVARSHLERCLEIQTAHDDPRRVVTLNNLCNVLEQDLALQECLDRLDEIPPLMPAYESVVGPDRVVAARWATSVKRSSICAMLGRSADALVAGEAAVSAAQELRSDHQMVTALVARAAAKTDVGDLDGAEADLTLAASVAGDSPLLGDVRKFEAVVAVARNRLAVAYDLVQESLRRTEEHEVLRIALRLMWRGEIELRRGDVAGASATVTRGLRLVTDNELGEPVIGLLHQTARLLRADGREDDAAEVERELRLISAATGQIIPVVFDVARASDNIEGSGVDPFAASRRALAMLQVRP